MPLAPGTQLGPYQILAQLGAGGMGEVYRARDTRLDREVAIKILPASFAQDGDRLRRFEQEARAIAALNHPNILAIHDIGNTNSTHYLVTELLEGESLLERLRIGPLPLRKALEIEIQAARGVAAAHDKGIVHRDLKPANLFITDDGRVKILDFGLARLANTADALLSESLTLTQAEPAGTEPGLVLGTVGYMSPEQVRGKPADARSDIFALGAILYEMLSGKRAFQKDSAADTMAAILHERSGRATNVGATGGIYQTDFIGSGQIGNPLPTAQTSATCGTMGGSCNYSLYNVGAFMRQVGPGGLTNSINNYNTNIAGLPTPAGQDLINSGLVSIADLRELGGVALPIAAPPPGQVGLGWLKDFDMTFSWV